MTPALAGAATLTVAIIVIAVAIWAGTRSHTPDAKAAAKAVYGVRRWYVGFLSVVALLAAARTLPFESYSPEASDVTVKITGAMWSWTVEGAQAPLPVGKRIDLVVMATDVNHGMAIYDESGRILTQVQAMPGVENHLNITFDRPGTYRVVCLEYCGLMHHMMATTLEVK
ncbi:MAG: cytochrome c oxidase subunit II [Deltaproteobacteria bacterium]|nr:cytochrome c oxidase subunit II [Deltaproteobacteria bacterium]